MMSKRPMATVSGLFFGVNRVVTFLLTMFDKKIPILQILYTVCCIYMLLKVKSSENLIATKMIE